MAKQDLASLTKKERRQLLKDLQQQQETASRAKSNLIRLVVGLAALLIIGGGIYLSTRPASPKQEVGDSVPEQSREHIEQGSVEHLPYSTNPPTSGPHWPEAAKCQIYTDEIPDEAAIHSLEHGAVWLTYKDKDDKVLAGKLATIVEKSPAKVILSPRSKNDSEIAVVSWTRILKLENFDEQKIQDYIKNYKGAAPEPLGPC